MKTLQVVLALGVLLAIALALYVERPAPPDDSAFGSEMALPTSLAPLEFPGGALELAGTVHTSAGAPAVDVLVSVLSDAAGDGDPTKENTREPLLWTYTDAAGHFALSNAQAGKYRVVLSHPSVPPRAFALELPRADASALSWELAAPLPPLPHLPEIQRTNVNGRVLAPALAEAPAALPVSALEGFEVVLVPAPENALLSGACELRALVDAHGGFAFEHVVVAAYRVEVLPPWAQGGSWPIVARGAFTATAGAASALELTLVVGALSGELHELEGRPLAGAMVKLASLEAQDAVGEAETWPAEVTDASGRFRIEFLPPGRYSVHLRAGLAQEDVEVKVEAGKLATVVLAPLDPRTGG